MKTGKIKSFFPGKKSKMKKSPTFFYNLPYKSYEKSPVMKLKMFTVFTVFSKRCLFLEVLVN